MEGLPYDFGIEEDSDGEEEPNRKKKKQLSKGIIEAIKADLESDTETHEAHEEVPATKERLLEPEREISIDRAPELDAEAPLEHLSSVERTAISQTLAVERLAEIQEEDGEDLSSANLAAESFLEAVEVSGDIDQAYQEVIIELGEAAIDSTALPETDFETETALPVDPESLIEQARSELSPNVTYNIREEAPEPTVEYVRPAVTKTEAAPKHKRRERIHTGLVDYVVGRRFARINEQSKGQEKEVEKKLEVEISDLKLQLASHETHVREIAKNKSFEKKPKASKAEKAEAPVKDTKEKTKEHHTKERAGIGAHTMRRAELLELASHIEIEGVSLKEMFKSNLLGEKGLRRVMAEYLRGGNYKKILSREMIEREKDFERDPELRDRGSRDATDSESNNLDKLLSKSGIDWDEPKPPVQSKNSKAERLDDLGKARDNNKKVRNPVRTAVDVVMVATIAALAATIAVLVIGR